MPPEPDQFSANTEVDEFVIGPDDGTTHRSSRSAAAVDLYEQGDMLKWLQRHWSDNMVSYTLSFDPETIAADVGAGPYFVRDVQGQLIFDQGQAVTHPAAAAAVQGYLEDFGAWLAPDVKAASLLPVYPEVSAQLPEEPISEAEYNRRAGAIQPFDRNQLPGPPGSQRLPGPTGHPPLPSPSRRLCRLASADRRGFAHRQDIDASVGARFERHVGRRGIGPPARAVPGSGGPRRPVIGQDPSSVLGTFPPGDSSDSSDSSFPFLFLVRRKVKKSETPCHCCHRGQQLTLSGLTPGGR